MAQIVAAARQRLQDSGRVIVEVRIDGVTLSPDELEQDQGGAVEAEEVRLYSADPRQLVTQALDQVHEQLGVAGKRQEEAADALQRDKPRDAMRHLGDAIHIWAQLRQAVEESVGLMGVKPDEVTCDGKPLSDAIEQLATRLRELREAVQQRDTVTLADRLAYEWPELTERWRRVLVSLGRQFVQSPPPSP